MLSHGSSLHGRPDAWNPVRTPASSSHHRPLFSWPLRIVKNLAPSSPKCRTGLHRRGQIAFPSCFPNVHRSQVPAEEHCLTNLLASERPLLPELLDPRSP